MKRSLIALLVIGSLAGGSYYAYLQQQTNNSQILSYQTSAITRGDVEQIVASAGQLEPVDQVDILAEISGQISEVFVTYNDEVTVGQLMARVDPSTFEAQLEQAEADVVAAKANIRVQQANLEQAEITLGTATRDLKRHQDLLNKGHISSDIFEQANDNQLLAASRVEAQEAQLAQAQAQLLQREAALTQAKLDLEQTYIRSPIDGIVLSRDLEPGQVISTNNNDSLLSLARSLDSMEIIANIDEADITLVQQGKPVRFSVSAAPEREFQGQITQIRKAAQNTSGVVTYPVVISVENRGQFLLPGMTADMEIVIAQESNTLRISNQALRFGSRQELTELPAPSAENASRQPGQGGEENNGRGGIGREDRGPLAGLELSEEQMAEYREQTAKLRESAQNSSSPLASSAPGPQRRQRPNRDAMDNILKKILTPAQLETYQAQQKTRENSTVSFGQVSLLSESGELQTVQVRLGISDGTWTQISAVPGLELEGAHAVIRQK